MCVLVRERERDCIRTEEFRVSVVTPLKLSFYPLISDMYLSIFVYLSVSIYIEKLRVVSYSDNFTVCLASVRQVMEKKKPGQQGPQKLSSLKSFKI